MPADLVLEPLLVPSGAVPPPTVAAGANAGTSPPAPTLSGGANLWRGTVGMGTGTTPAAGILAAVTFPFTLPSVPFVAIFPTNAASAALVLMIDAVTTTGFNIVTENAPAASQTVGTYACSYIIIMQ